MMQNKNLHLLTRGLICLLMTLMVLSSLPSMQVSADEAASGFSKAAATLTYDNDETGFTAYVMDKADLIDDDKESDLLEQIKPMTEYGHAMFVTVNDNPRTVEAYAFDLYDEYFGAESGFIFMIDMDNRKVHVETDGYVYSIITSAYADTITDNVYTYASSGDYYGCAETAFSQALILLQGGRIARPMKYISIGLFSLVLAVLVNFLILRSQREKAQKSASSPLPQVNVSAGTIKPAHITASLAGMLLIKETIHHHVDSSSGGGGGGGGFSGGGGGGGGGHSGGGGSHSF